MAKKSETTDLEPVKPAGALALPSFLKLGSTLGAEGMTKDDLKIPRICLAQALGKALNEDRPEYIEGLKVGEMYNDLTRENYGKGPLEIVVVRRDKPRGIEFIDMDSGGGVKDFNVPIDDPRMQFTTDEKGDRVKPLATKFYDYIVVILPMDFDAPISRIAALSFKGSGLKMAQVFNSLIAMKPLDVFARRYLLTSSKETNTKGTYAAFSVAYAPRINPALEAGLVEDEETFRSCGKLYEIVKDKKVAFDDEPEREPGSDDGDVPAGM